MKEKEFHLPYLCKLEFGVFHLLLGVHIVLVRLSIPTLRATHTDNAAYQK